VTDPVVGAVSAEDTALTRGDRGHAEDLVRETIMRFGIWAARWQLAGPLGLVLLRRERPETATARPLPTPVMPVLTAEDRALARARSGCWLQENSAL
jgi:hypothetical protein